LLEQRDDETFDQNYWHFCEVTYLVLKLRDRAPYNELPVLDWDGGRVEPGANEGSEIALDFILVHAHELREEG